MESWIYKKKQFDLSLDFHIMTAIKTNNKLIDSISKYFPGVGLILALLNILYMLLILCMIAFIGYAIALLFNWVDLPPGGKINKLNVFVIGTILQILLMVFVPEIRFAMEFFLYILPSQYIFGVERVDPLNYSFQF
jgi:hypothetical protein